MVIGSSHNQHKISHVKLIQTNDRDGEEWDRIRPDAAPQSAERTVGKVKGYFHPKKGHEDPDGE